MATTTTGMGAPLLLFDVNQNTYAQLRLCKGAATAAGPDYMNPTVNMEIKGQANAAAADTVTITNASHGQATVWTLPDPGGAAASFVHTLGGQTLAGSLTLSSGNLTASAGNVVAGSSGNAGTVSSFPATASKGSLQLVGVANTGNTNTVISNAAMGQASTISIPDPAQATADFVVAPNALVANNYPVASGTAGLVTDSGVGSVTMTLNTAAVTGAYAAPVQLIAAPGSGKTIIIMNATIAVASTGNTAYATGGVAVIQYGNTVHGAGTTALAASTIPAANVTAAANSVIQEVGPTAAVTGAGNLGIYFSNQTGAYTNGTGTNLIIQIEYFVVPVSV